MSELRSILVLAPNWLGDAVMALPAIADLRRQHADARLTIAARTSVAPLFTLVPGVDDVVTLRWRGRLLQRREIDADVARLQAANAEAALLLPNSFAAAWVVRRARVRERWGYATDFRSRLLTRAIPVLRDSVHQARYYQRLTTALGITAGALEPALRVPPAAVEAMRVRLRTAGWDGGSPIVTLAPGAAYGTAKRWLPSYVGDLIVRLTREHGARAAIVGAAADRETVRGILAMPAVSAAAPIDLTGDTSLAELAAVLSLSSACVSNDSGAMHLAGALGTPLSAIFGPTRETETAPLAAAGGRVDVLIHPVWCRPCMLRECPIDHRCMRGLRPERVAASVAGLLRGAA